MAMTGAVRLYVQGPGQSRLIHDNNQRDVLTQTLRFSVRDWDRVAPPPP
jgi:hypothetical protein